MKSRRELVFSAAGLGAGLLVASAAQARTISASLSPATEGVSDSSESGFVTVSVSGGVGPYTYQWVRISGIADIVPTDPTSPVTQFQWIGAFNGPPRLAAYVCQVTDSTNDTTSTGSVHIGYSS